MIRHLKSPILFAILICVASILPAHAQSDDSTMTTAPAEAPSLNEIKAQYFLKFAELIEWPEERFKRPSSPVLIGILGNETFDGELEAFLKGKTVGGRSIQFAKSVDMVKADECHILFIDRQLQRQFRTSLRRFAKRGILTVGEWEGFANDGGIIAFIESEGQVTFEIAPDVAKSAGLRIASDLLSLGQIVHPKLKANK